MKQESFDGFFNRDECNVFGMAERNNKSAPWVQGPFYAFIRQECLDAWHLLQYKGNVKLSCVD